MKTKLIVLTAFSLFILILGMGCKKNDYTLTSTNHLGIPFFLKAKEIKSLTAFKSGNNSSDSSLIVYFKKIIYDSRCPKSLCYLSYGSTAKIQVLLTLQNRQSILDLTILGGQDEYECSDQLYYHKDTLGYRICLLRLDPYPTGIPIDSTKYIAKLNITKL